jgi:hypothetical protein
VPQAALVHDKFHVAAHLNEAVVASARSGKAVKIG